ncbi:MAG: bifunctional adenosylcobinamide kinase/adenosylcobinamide-phosphate guanylyltransferase [Lachnospiraceae bacterium]
MKLVIGGYAQGKLNYVLQKYDIKTSKILDGEIPENMGEQRETVVINHLHNWIRSRIVKDGCPEKEILAFVENYPDCVIISDEVGNGIVPIEAFEREYRERTGRILVELAKKAEEVERVICGIGQKIK